jgi:hypothetical protein
MLYMMILSKYRIVMEHFLSCAKYLVHPVINGVFLPCSPYPYCFLGLTSFSNARTVFDSYMAREAYLVLGCSYLVLHPKYPLVN